MPSALDSLVKSGQLKVEPTSKAEMAGFLANANQALLDAQISELSSPNRFKPAYDAAHALSLVHTVGAPAALAASLNRYHAKRNRSEYDGLVTTADAEARDMLALTKDLKALVVSWLKQHRPELLA